MPIYDTGTAKLRDMINGIASDNANVEMDVPPDPEVSVTPEDFNVNFNDLQRAKRQPSELKEVVNEQAVIAVVKKSNLEILYFTDKFYLQTFQEARNEKLQVIETFGEPQVSFFGERVKTYQGAGFLMESDSHNSVYPAKYRWASALNRFYEKYLRGSELAKQDNIAILFIGNYRLHGYFMNLIINSNASDPYKKQFSFNFLVTKHDLIIKNELDVLYNLYQRLSFLDRENFTSLKRDLESYKLELDDTNTRLLSTSITQSERQSLEKTKTELMDLVSATIGRMKNLLLKSDNIDLEG